MAFLFFVSLSLSLSACTRSAAAPSLTFFFPSDNDKIETSLYTLSSAAAVA